MYIYIFKFCPATKISIILSLLCSPHGGLDDTDRLMVKSSSVAAEERFFWGIFSSSVAITVLAARKRDLFYP